MDFPPQPAPFSKFGILPLSDKPHHLLSSAQGYFLFSSNYSIKKIPFFFGGSKVFLIIWSRKAICQVISPGLLNSRSDMRVDDGRSGPLSSPPPSHFHLLPFGGFVDNYESFRGVFDTLAWDFPSIPSQVSDIEVSIFCDVSYSLPMSFVKFWKLGIIGKTVPGKMHKYLNVLWKVKHVLNLNINQRDRDPWVW